MYSSDSKTVFSASLHQFLVSHDPSEFILICSSMLLFFFKYKNVRLYNAFNVIFDQLNASLPNKYSLKLIISIGKNAYHTL